MILKQLGEGIANFEDGWITESSSAVAITGPPICTALRAEDNHDDYEIEEWMNEPCQTGAVSCGRSAGCATKVGKLDDGEQRKHAWKIWWCIDLNVDVQFWSYVHFVCCSSPAVQTHLMNSTPVKMWSPKLISWIGRCDHLYCWLVGLEWLSWIGINDGTSNLCYHRNSWRGTVCLGFCSFNLSWRARRLPGGRHKETSDSWKCGRPRPHICH